MIVFPRVSADRGGIRFRMDWTPEEIAAAEASRAFIARTVSALAQRRNAVVDAACVEALANGWDVHVYEPPTPLDIRHASGRDLLYLRHVGIAFTLRQRPIPTVHYHQRPDEWEWEDDE